MNVDLNCERLVEMKSNVITINEQLVIADSMHNLPTPFECFATCHVASNLVGIGFLIVSYGCDVSTPDASTLSDISTTSAIASGRDTRTISPRVIDLGEVSPGGQVSQWFEINNPFPHDVEIGEIRVGCECVSVKMDHTVVRAGQSVRAQVTADLSHSPEFLGDLRVSVELSTDEAAMLARFAVALSAVPVGSIESASHQPPLAL
jgi:hypothetical protein